MLGGSLILRLVCLLSFLWPHVASLYRTTYIDNLRRGQAGWGLKRNAFYSGSHRTNYSWLSKINPMEFAYTRKNKWSHSNRRQDIYDGSDFDWEGFPAEDTPTWPPDYNSWPQTATQAPPQVLPEYPPLVPTQAPLQGPYEEPPVVPTQMSVPVVPQVSPPLTVSQARPPFSTSQSQIWPSRVRPQNDMKLPVKLEARNASRVCSPGPPLIANPLFRNCLVIGDSISLGYLTTVKGELKGLCQVQHAPFAKGSGAVDSRYGLQCLSMMLHTTALEPTSYDAVVFNFGMHDIDYSKLFPELRISSDICYPRMTDIESIMTIFGYGCAMLMSPKQDETAVHGCHSTGTLLCACVKEFVPLKEYGQNLMKIKELLLQSGAQVAFALTTPVPIAGRRNKRVVKYNKEARRVMEKGRKVEIVDLHSAVIQECGEPPYETCSIMKRPRDVHFNPKGNRLLGVKVGAAFRSLLSKAKPRGQLSPPKAPELSAREGLASSYLHDDTSTFCPDMVTRCPTRTTCGENLLSLTGYGCCMEPDAVNCPDNWHCCPRGTHCSPDCNFRSCKCVFPSFHPAAVPKLGKEAKESKMKPKSHSESNSASSKVSKESESKKVVSKTEKGKKKTKAKDTNASKSRKKAIGKSKHKFKLKDKKHKKHKKHKHGRKDKGRKKTKKARSKAKDKGAKYEKLKKLKKTQANHKINKHVVKAHRTYQQNNFHPTTKQPWLTHFDDRLGAVTQHKPNIKFSHTWGRRKHQKLSFKWNGKKKIGLQKYASMADELKHLIVKHRKETLRKRLKLRVNDHTKGNHGSDRNRLTDRRKTTTRKKGKGRSIHSTHTRNTLKHRDSNSSLRHKNVKARKTPHEVKATHKVETNKSRHEEQMLGHENRVSVNIFNNLRQTLHEKVLAKENTSLGLNPSKHNGKIAEHFATNTSDNKTDELGKTRFDNILKSETVADSSKDHQRTSSSSNKSELQYMNMVKFKKMSLASKNASTSLVEHSHNSATSNYSYATNEGEPNNTIIVSASNVVTKEVRIQPRVDERESRTNSSIINKSNSNKSEKDEGTAGENQDKLVKVNGKVKLGTGQQNKTLATSSAKNVSRVDIDRVPLVTAGMQDQAKADWVGSGSGLEADKMSIGSASGLEMAAAGAKNVSSANTDSIPLAMGMDNRAKADWVGSGSGLEADKISIGSASGLEMSAAGAKNVSSADTKSVSFMKGVHHQAKADWVGSGSGLEADKISIGSASVLEMAAAGAKNASSADTKGVSFATGVHHQAKADWVGSGNELKTEEFSVGSASGLEVVTTFSGDYDDSNIDEHIKVFQDGDNTESSTTDLEKNKTTKKLPLAYSSSGSSTNEGEESSKTSPRKKLNAESEDVESFSGSSFETFSSESGGDFQFGGEGDHGYEEKPQHGDQKDSYSSGRDDSYESGLFISSGMTSLNQWQTLKATEDEQSIRQQNKYYPSDNSLLTDLSQMSYSDWDDARETYSGLGSGHYESSTDLWDTGSGVNGLSSASFSTDAIPTPSRYYTAAKISDIINSVYQTSGDSDKERNKNEIVSREGMNLEKRNHVFTSNSDNQIQLSEEKRRRGKSLQQQHTKKTKDIENNEFLSWENRELKQLLYWLSVANNDDNKHLNQIMAYKDIASGYSRLHSMVLQKILHRFSKSEREVKMRNGKEKKTFRPDTSLVSSASGSLISIE